MMHTPPRWTFHVVPIARIDPPPAPMRETMSDEGLASLADSIRARGLLHPLGVIQDGDRFRVVYGHRRRVALELAQVLEAPCFVYPAGTSGEEAMKVDENTEREDVNPAAQATYYRWMLEEKCGGDVGRLCTVVGRREDFVQSRLALTTGYPEVLDALRADTIPIAMAHELNRVHDDTYRRLFLDDAANQGLNTAAVRTMRLNWERQEQMRQAQASGAHADVAPSSEAPIATLDHCVLCNSTEDPQDMEYRRIHRSCMAVLDRKARAALAREGNGA